MSTVSVASTALNAWESRRYTYQMTSDAAENVARINDAISTVHADGGGTVEFSHGTFLVSDEIRLRGKTTLLGQGRAATFLQAASNMGQGKFVVAVDNVTYPDATNDYDRWGIKSLCVHGNRSFKHAHGGIRVSLGDNTSDFLGNNPDNDSVIEDVLVYRTAREGVKFQVPASFESVRSITVRNVRVDYCGHVSFFSTQSDATYSDIYAFTGSDSATFTESGNTITITGGGQGGIDWADNTIASTTIFGSTVAGRHYLIGMAGGVAVVARQITGNSHDGSGNPTITYSGTAGSFATAGATSLEWNCAHGMYLFGSTQQVTNFEGANLRGSCFIDRSSRNQHSNIIAVDVNGDGIFAGTIGVTVAPFFVTDANRRNIGAVGGPNDVSAVYNNSPGGTFIGHVEDWSATDGHTVNAIRFGAGGLASAFARIAVSTTTTTPALVQGTPGPYSDVNVYYTDGSGAYIRRPQPNTRSQNQTISADTAQFAPGDGVDQIAFTLDTSRTLTSNPHITDGTHDGQTLTLINVDGGSDTLTLTDGNGVELSAATVVITPRDVIEFRYVIGSVGLNQWVQTNFHANP